ncbi:hypothetical protein J1614_005919 [Plenodomus biglobosus]|nr:hypothetical protein J1614_005919 [Plenodomus biglobosus]
MASQYNDCPSAPDARDSISQGVSQSLTLSSPGTATTSIEVAPNTPLTTSSSSSDAGRVQRDRPPTSSTPRYKKRSKFNERDSLTRVTITGLNVNYHQILTYSSREEFERVWRGVQDHEVRQKADEQKAAQQKAAEQKAADKKAAKKKVAEKKAAEKKAADKKKKSWLDWAAWTNLDLRRWVLTKTIREIEASWELEVEGWSSKRKARPESTAEEQGDESSEQGGRRVKRKQNGAT